MPYSHSGILYSSKNQLTNSKCSSINRFDEVMFNFKNLIEVQYYTIFQNNILNSVLFRNAA